MPNLALLDQRALSKLRWRCRRGLLENDLFIERFFAKHGAELTVEQATGLEILMDLSDNDLMDLFLARKQPEATLDRPDVHQVLSMVRNSKNQFAHPIHRQPKKENP